MEFFNNHRFHIDGKKCILVLDGHASHLSIDAIDFCIKNLIELICLPPHTSHRLQPMDTHFNRGLKVNWSKNIQKYLRESDKVILTKHEVLIVFNPTWTSAISSRGKIVDAFAYCGIFPARNPA